MYFGTEPAKIKNRGPAEKPGKTDLNLKKAEKSWKKTEKKTEKKPEKTEKTEKNEKKGPFPDNPAIHYIKAV